MEPKTEREFFLLLIEQMKHIRIDLDEVKDRQGSKASKTSLEDIEVRLKISEDILAALRVWHDKEEALRQAREEAQKKAIEILELEQAEELRKVELRNGKAKTWQTVLAIIGSAAVTSVIIWYYLK